MLNHSVSAFKKEISNYYGKSQNDFNQLMKDCWFEVVGQMYVRNIHIPEDWNYFPNGNPLDNECLFHKFFKLAKNYEIIELAKYITKYLQLFGKF